MMPVRLKKAAVAAVAVTGALSLSAMAWAASGSHHFPARDAGAAARVVGPAVGGGAAASGARPALASSGGSRAVTGSGSPATRGGAAYAAAGGSAAAASAVPAGELTAGASCAPGRP
jgi:hypothetical protein